MIERLEALRAAGLADLDAHFARFVAHLAGSDAPELALAACLASRATASGHVCVDLAALAGGVVMPEEGVDAPADVTPVVAPGLDAWTAALRASPVVGAPGEHRPLVLDGRGRLYLHRYWAYERRLADDLLARAAVVEEVDERRLRADLVRLFGPAQEGEVDWQRIAAATAALRRLCVISGGPGTGKTSIVVRILALLAAQAHGRLRAGLVAPTGKAAARLAEAVRAAKRREPLDPAARDAIPEDACTIHRLLGPRSGSVAFRHDRANPLPLDVLVVDEASMVDLALMAKLVAALPPAARLVVLGDRDQLASVEAGAVLGDVCGPAPGLSEACAARLAAVTGAPVPAAAGGTSALGDSVVLLRRSWRFGAESGIGRLAAAVNRGDGAGALALLEEGGFSDVVWRPMTVATDVRPQLDERALEGFRPYLDRVVAGADVGEAFAAFAAFRVLCAHRVGPAGAETVNHRLEARLRASVLGGGRGPWYAGRPVLVTQNDYELRLFNGDVGIVLPDPAARGALRVHFEAADGAVRRVPPARLPAHETAWAMTVHKSQGSEFDAVLLVLPTEPSRVLTRELIYTAVTRARRRVEVWGEAQTLRAAVERPLVRSSGLRDALWGERTQMRA
ncbi:MAG TPA: exodeoxyribonuclease V subunit alpha [Candidatus Binatia bacterium]|nr:exodeoxyribonuclease V subunit alpha [Candidatus Binatia bacterium]